MYEDEDDVGMKESIKLLAIKLLYIYGNKKKKQRNILPYIILISYCYTIFQRQ